MGKEERRSWRDQLADKNNDRTGKHISGESYQNPELDTPEKCSDIETAEISSKLSELKSILSQISGAVGVSIGPDPSDDEEDRRRIKERFRDALERDQHRRIMREETTGDKWMEYIFGISKPDGRIGKVGSRCHL